MAADRGGYLLLTANGRVFSFGGAHNYGSATSSCPGAPAVAIATSSEARGYWIAFANARAYALSPNARAPHCGAASHKRVATSKSGTAATDLFHRLNDERRARGLAPLQWDATLAEYATHWSKVMGAQNSMHHSNIGDLLGPYNYVGENIAMGSRGVSAGALHNNWMHSQFHRDNILSPGFRNVGIGVVLRAQRLDLADAGVRPAEQRGPAARVRRQHRAGPGRAAGIRPHGLLTAGQAQIPTPGRCSIRRPGDRGPRVGAV